MLHFADPYPEELLYSAWARSASHLQYTERNTYLRDISGGVRYTVLPDFPRHLDRFVASLPDPTSYAIDELIHQHTLYPLYYPFLTPGRVAHVQAHMRGQGRHNLYWSLGLTRNMIPRRGWFRHCPDCISADRSAYGETYWHRVHQIWGVLVCPIHQSELLTWDIADERRAWRMPMTAEEAVSSLRLSMPLEPHEHLMAHQIAVACAALLAMLRPQVNLQERYQLLLKSQECLTPTGMVRTQKLMRQVEAVFSQSLLKRLGCAFDWQKRAAVSWLPRMFGRLSKSQYPLLHIVTMLALHTSVENFFDTALPPVSSPFREGPWPCFNPTCEWYQQRVISSCQLSRRVAQKRQTGTFTCTCGFAYRRTVYGDERDLEMTDAGIVVAFGNQWLYQFQENWGNIHLPLCVISRKLGVSVPVLRTCAAELGLEHRQSAMNVPIEENLHTRREQWLRACTQDGHITQEEFERKHGRLRRLLNRYDYAWYKTHPLLPVVRNKTATPPRPLRLPSEWNKYDEEMAQEINTYAQVLQQASGPPRRRSLSVFAQKIVRVDKIRWSPERYPRSVEMLAQVVENREQFIVRKIQWLVAKWVKERKCLGRHLFLDHSGAIYVLQYEAIRAKVNAAFILLMDYFPDKHLTLFEENEVDEEFLGQMRLTLSKISMQ